jgi:hypothetical protein
MKSIRLLSNAFCHECVDVILCVKLVEMLVIGG